MPSDQGDLVGVSFPSGVKNVEYGVWRSRCCGDEIVLYRGAVFPMCNTHKDGVTEWVLIATDLFSKPNVAVVTSRAAARSVASSERHLTTDRMTELSTGGVVSSEIECGHLMGCEVCRSVLDQFADKHYRQRQEERDREKSA